MLFPVRHLINVSQQASVSGFGVGLSFPVLFCAKSPRCLYCFEKLRYC